jgi:hypothetical protein
LPNNIFLLKFSYCNDFYILLDIVWYFRALGCKIGKNVCLYPTGGDPMMTEPDLVTIGDNVAINNASVVGHINSRGKFRLNNILS